MSDAEGVPEPKENNRMSKFKLIGVVVLAVLAIIIVLGNLAPSEVWLLFMTVKMPLAILILVMLTAGFGIGVLVSLILLQKGKLPKKE